MLADLLSLALSLVSVVAAVSPKAPLIFRHAGHENDSKTRSLLNQDGLKELPDNRTEISYL
jgi:hypothetical protein